MGWYRSRAGVLHHAEPGSGYERVCLDYGWVEVDDDAAVAELASQVVMEATEPGPVDPAVLAAALAEQPGDEARDAIAALETREDAEDVAAAEAALAEIDAGGEWQPAEQVHAELGDDEPKRRKAARKD